MIRRQLLLTIKEEKDAVLGSGGIKLTTIKDVTDLKVISDPIPRNHNLPYLLAVIEELYIFLICLKSSVAILY